MSSNITIKAEFLIILKMALECNFKKQIVASRGLG